MLPDGLDGFVDIEVILHPDRGDTVVLNLSKVADSGPEGGVLLVRDGIVGDLFRV